MRISPVLPGIVTHDSCSSTRSSFKIAHVLHDAQQILSYFFLSLTHAFYVSFEYPNTWSMNRIDDVHHTICNAVSKEKRHKYKKNIRKMFTFVQILFILSVHNEYVPFLKDVRKKYKKINPRQNQRNKIIYNIHILVLSTKFFMRKIVTFEFRVVTSHKSKSSFCKF